MLGIALNIILGIPGAPQLPSPSAKHSTYAEARRHPAKVASLYYRELRTRCQSLAVSYTHLTLPTICSV
eukprot:7041365-Alexandrium_andersonii.AAC.1